MRRFSVLWILLFLFFTRCVVVKEYNKVAINDEDMKLQAVDCERFETNFQIYPDLSVLPTKCS